MNNSFLVNKNQSLNDLPEPFLNNLKTKGLKYNDDCKSVNISPNKYQKAFN